MLGSFLVLYCAGIATAKLHHFFVGETESIAIHALELDDELRTLSEMGIIPAQDTAPTLAIDVRCLTDFEKLSI